MKRRDSLKTLLVGTVAGATLGSTIGCKTDGTATSEATSEVAEAGLYGRVPKEIKRDKKIAAEVYLNEHELTTIAVLCDIILPATEDAGAASDAEVPVFIDFIVKDIPSHQLPIRGGLMWLDGEANHRFNKEFVNCSNAEQIQIVEDIAYPDEEGKKPLMAPGIKFFDRMRNLTLTGYYTTRMGLDDLGYTGNYANVWDGVPAEVLKDHEVDYDPEWLAKCVDQNKRMDIAKWDEQGNLLT